MSSKKKRQNMWNFAFGWALSILIFMNIALLLSMSHENSSRIESTNLVQNRTKVTPEKSKDIRVAVCFSGIVRTLNTDLVLDNIISNLIEPNHADVFMFVNPSVKGEIGKETQKILHPNSEFRVVTMEHVVERLKPVTIEYYNSVVEPILPLAPCFHREFRGFVEIWKWWPQYWGMRQCFRLITEHESNTGIRYDMIIRARPDVMYPKPVRNTIPCGNRGCTFLLRLGDALSLLWTQFLGEDNGTVKTSQVNRVFFFFFFWNWRSIFVDS
jgi:hypothetical protein